MTLEVHRVNIEINADAVLSVNLPDSARLPSIPVYPRNNFP